MDQHPLLRFSTYSHLEGRAKLVSATYASLARELDQTLPDGSEKSVALRKLLESKDAAVRSTLT